jgi:hypothetical protein
MRAVSPRGGGDEQRMDIVRRILKETPLIDGLVIFIFYFIRGNLHGWVLDDYIFLNSLIFHELRYFSSGGK